METMENIATDIRQAMDDSIVPNEAILLYADNVWREVDADLIADAEDRYLGSAWSVREWAEEWATDIDLLAGMPEDLRYYFDYDAWARDGFMSGDIFLLAEDDGRKHIFHS